MLVANYLLKIAEILIVIMTIIMIIIIVMTIISMIIIYQNSLFSFFISQFQWFSSSQICSSTNIYMYSQEAENPTSALPYILSSLCISERFHYQSSYLMAIIRLSQILIHFDLINRAKAMIENIMPMVYKKNLLSPLFYQSFIFNRWINKWCF